jgi:PAS domain S-box-containing protein
VSIKILLVVDSPTERLAIKNIFQHEYCVLTAHNSLEAMLIIDAHSDIDLLILDLTMPDNDSIQVLEALNRDKKGRNLRTIILTKHDEIDKEIEGLRLGADDYIRKPLHMNSLKVRIDTHIQLLKVQRLYQHELHENSLKYEGIFQKAPVGIAISFLRKPLSNFDKKLTSINPMYEKITGRTKEELLKLGWSAITHPEDSIEEQKKFNQLKSGEINGYSMEKRYIRPDGSIVWVDMVVARLDSEPDADFNHICIIQDITNRKAIEQVLLESERSKSVLLASLPGLAYRCKRRKTLHKGNDRCHNCNHCSSSDA